MHGFFWLFPAGVFLPLCFPVLPDKGWLFALAPLALGGLMSTHARPAAGMLLGVLYGCGWGHIQLAERLPEALDKVDVQVVGVVHSLPDVQDHRTRFEFRVEEMNAGEARSLPDINNLLLSWYGAPPVRAGERWRLNVRLRTPRGFANPGGFDYESWLMSKGISATGYVRDDANVKLEDSRRLSVSAFRQSLRDEIFARGFEDETAAYLAALVLGDKSRISPDAFDRLVATGTVHLMVVSGMHITLVAALSFALALPFCRALAATGVGPPAKVSASVAAMIGAVVYSFVAGMGLPVLRALVMSLAALLAVTSRRRISPWRIFAMALSIVALVDPMAALSNGFWLSFVAVAALLWWFMPRPPVSAMRRLFQAQLAVFVALSPWLVYFLGTSPIIAVPVNLVVVPWISLVVTPLGLAGTLLHDVPLLSDWLLQLAAWQLDYFARLLHVATDVGALRVERAAFMRSADRVFLMAGCTAAVLIMFPRGSGLKVPLLVCVPALILSRAAPPPALQITVLDVGQGLAVVVRAAGETLVYDAGPAFSPVFDTGEAVVAPYLMSRAIHRLNRLVISHRDNDHAGGAEGLLGRISADRLMAGEPEFSERFYEQCRRGQGWYWGDVRFRVIWPDEVNRRVAVTRRNDRSCVLLIELGTSAILLPGDIEKRVEQLLADEWPDLVGKRLDLLVAAHHGSKTSSSELFVSTTNPRHVVFSAGFNHHFRHPNEAVTSRFQDAGATMWNTAYHGAVTFSWTESGEMYAEPFRQTHRRYWRGSTVYQAGLPVEL